MKRSERFKEKKHGYLQKPGRIFPGFCRYGRIGTKENRFITPLFETLQLREQKMRIQEPSEIPYGELFRFLRPSSPFRFYSAFFRISPLNSFCYTSLESRSYGE
jgi:hypothetical protein